jgi:hypothetical protein
MEEAGEVRGEDMKEDECESLCPRKKKKTRQQRSHAAS